MKKATLRSSGPVFTGKLGERLGRLATRGDVLAPSGDLGAGKTCLVQGLARGLGIDERVASPSFNIVLEHHGARLPLFHIDLYRIAEPGELDELGLEIYLYGEGVTAVEWIDRFPTIAPPDRLEIAISLEGVRRRRLDLSGHGPRGEALLEELLLDLPVAGQGSRKGD